MCINPASLPDGTTFGCRKCWQCIEHAIQDWVGRCIAETKTSSHVFSTTATYGGGDHERATVLTYSDVQWYFKRLRKAGFKFKYLVAGEYGTTKGRSHWHMILFFNGAAPEHKLRQNFSDPFWPHGFSFWDEPNAKAIRYVCKYIKKTDGDDEAQGKFMMSKKPPIGTEYFAGMAQSHVDAGLPPQDLFYRFAENLDRDGKPVKHMMAGATARDFLQAFINKWWLAHPDTLWPKSELVDDFADSLVVNAPDLHMQSRAYGSTPTWLPRRTCVLGFSDTHNAHVTKVDGVPYYWWPLDPENPRGQQVWRNVQGHVIQWQASDKYADQARESARLKAIRERRLASPPSGAMGSSSPNSPEDPRSAIQRLAASPNPQDRQRQQQARRDLAHRLPMRGDGWG